MKSYENLVSPESEYYVYSPSMTAREMFFYPLYVGHFFYEGGYSLHRDSYDSFLIMYIHNGSLTLEYEGHMEQVTSGHFVMIDCYKAHAYYSDTGWESIWCHFDGITARAHYDSIVSRLGNVFYMTDSFPILNKMNAIYRVFHTEAVVREPLMSKYLTDILTSFLLYTPLNVKTHNYINMAEEMISYISEHFAEDLSIGDLAALAGLSQYHFIRSFKKETGFTPHEYIIHTRISTAKYLLKNSRLSVKDICYNTGFSCESVFCSAFKKNTGYTPANYRALSTS